MCYIMLSDIKTMSGAFSAFGPLDTILPLPLFMVVILVSVVNFMLCGITGSCCHYDVLATQCLRVPWKMQCKNTKAMSSHYQRCPQNQLKDK